jgi:hypothetical protein
MSRSLIPHKSPSTPSPTKIAHSLFPSLLTSSSSSLTPEVYELHIRRVRGQSAIETMHHSNNVTDLNFNNPFTFPGKVWKIWGQILRWLKQGIFMVVLLVTGAVALYIWFLRSQLAGMQKKTAKVKENLEDLVNGGCRGW